MAMNRYANLTKKRVSAPHVPRVLPSRDSCLQNEKSLDPNASKNNQSSATISMAQLILSKKGALRKKGDFNCNSMEMNSATKNTSNGPRRSLFDMRSEDLINVDRERDGAENDDEDIDTVIFVNTGNEMEEDDMGFQDDENEDSEQVEELGSDNEDESENEIGEQVEEQRDGPDLRKNAAISTTRKRGPTMMHAIQVRGFDACETIACNKFGQPIGPVTKEKDTVGQFSRFLGIIARNASHAPLTYKSWPKVPNKEMMWKYVQEKYIVPEDAKSWVLMTIGACWRGYKCRIKKKHFYKFKDMQTRWKNRPKSIPQNDFSQLLTLWSKKDVMKRCLAARNLRLSQKNMHTAGPKSFARIREEMIEEDPNKEEPSLTGMFERTRQRKEGNVYADTYDDKANKIEKMRSYNPPEDESAPADAFLAVMNKEYDGHRRLFGRGVTNTLIKKVNGSGIASTVPREIVKSPTVSLEVEKGQSAHMQKELEANYERRISELKEDHARQLEAIQKQNEDDCEKLVEDAVRKILGKIPPEVIRGYLT
ncbi:transposase, Ptta/En/Spm [Artemisia annua]|uniref:Transposase, Ptta/En/Spm n=1 Tax=Artemisia annua TaxID=35608 RepID=A0A2U1L1Z5_ARTAN|nr:transposase, Ptta/En/Spm [Artemisia annua]